ncbi:nicotinate-nucleotide--dimethylbenzimidazole phosphoribosyltransferase [Hominifimenecus sp. rT4P-3]|uniref:nicotinate-nucleotide--dimethylbenzimidazole phosphoribosyltransferase n=1 Tax=Hominifimenecus sp. rT4P-3 TaxID=3242979 RepID=UPI003DA29F4B
MLIEETIHKITCRDARAEEQSRRRWDSIAKPLRSLGKLEDVVVQIAGITGTHQVRLEKKGVVICCADNGIVEEGVTQTGQEVTAIVAENFLDGKTSVAIMAKSAGADLFPMDTGMVKDTRVERHKTAYGTKNFTKEPAMTREAAIAAVEAGIRKVKELKEKGYRILATGEMGIGNTTTSSAMASVFLDVAPELVTGKGAGLTSAGLEKKIQVIKDGIALHQPDPSDPIDVLAKVGGFDIAGLTGVFLGCAAEKIPVVIDGFISGVAALTAVRLCPGVQDYLIASHVSKEPAGQMILDALGVSAFLTCNMCLGEGTGAVALFPLLDMGLQVYDQMSTFDQVEIEAYQPLA